MRASFASTSTSYLAGVLALALFGTSGCGDDGAPAPVDSAAEPDGMAAVDGPPGRPDAPPRVDAQPLAPDASPAPVGAACDADGACTSDVCITAAQGFPEGYCSYLGCDPGDPEACAPYGGDGICVDTGSVAFCLDQCDLDAPDCRDGYTCQDYGVGLCLPAPSCGNREIEYGEECDPPTAGTCSDTCQGLGAAATGQPCAGATDCAGDYCLLTESFADFIDGYCTQSTCDLDDPIGSCAGLGGGTCVELGESFAICLADCTLGGSDCRTGYTCFDFGAASGGTCWPTPICGNSLLELDEECDPPAAGTCTDTCQAIGGADVGAECTDSLGCLGNQCLGWPSGYCSQSGCDATQPETACAAYGGDAICLDAGGTGLCFDRCDLATPDCRPDYFCYDVGLGTQGICYPTPVCGNSDVEIGEECDPPAAGTCSDTCQGLGTTATGAACADAADCAGDTCLLTESFGDFIDGYCANWSCDPADPVTSCAAVGGGYCVELGDGFGACLADCTGSSDCRSGYDCYDFGLASGDGICWPVPVCGNSIIEGGEECDPPAAGTCSDACQGLGTTATGEACTTAADCAGDTCLLTESFGDFIDGYCANWSCDLANPVTSCAAVGGGYCVELATDFGVCLADCTGSSDCRSGYDCYDFGLASGDGICWPLPVCGDGFIDSGEECDPPAAGTCSDTCQGLGSTANGEACTSAADCAGDTCLLTESFGDFIDGYCANWSCDPADPVTSCAAVGAGYCVELGDGFGACFADCTGSADCRSGYDCYDFGLASGDGICWPVPVCGNGILESGEECDPPAAGTCSDACQGVGITPTGGTCLDATDCAGNMCIDAASNPSWADGYCTDYPCDVAAPTTSCAAAGGDGYCVDVGDTSGALPICLDQCNPVAPDCRSGYSCQAASMTISVCAPDGSAASQAIGDACTTATDCASGQCLDEASNPAWTGGYCSLTPCANDSACAAGGGGRCANYDGADRCLASCNGSCRTGYACHNFGGGVRACIPL